MMVGLTEPPEGETLLDQADFFRHCRELLELDDPQDAVDELLKGIITVRRLRRFENGQSPLPLRAWEVLADELEEVAYYEEAAVARRLSTQKTLQPTNEGLRYGCPFCAER